MNVRLKVLSGGSAGKEVKLQLGEFFIGRGDGCHLRPKSDAISRKHCVLVVDDTNVLVRDLQSRNGTLVNGEKIEGDRKLQRGDRLTVGPLEFEVIVQNALAGSAPAEAPASAPAKAAAQPVSSQPANSQPVSSPQPATETPKVKPTPAAPVELNVPRKASPSPVSKQPSAQKGESTDDDIFGWLEEGDEVDRAERMTDPATRQFRVGGKKSEEVPAEGETIDIAKAEASGDTKAAKKKKEFGKLPPVPDQTKKHDNSQAAAADALKQFFKRS